MAERMARGPLRAAGLASLARGPVLRLHTSHVYVNASLIAEVIGFVPRVLRSEGLVAVLPPDLRSTLWGRTAESGIARLASAGVTGARTAAIVIRLLAHERDWLPWRRAAAFERECASVRSAFADRPAPNRETAPSALYGEMANVRERLGDYLAVVSWGVVYAYVFYHLATELARRWAPALVEERAALTVGLGGVASLDLYHDLLALGPLLAREPRHITTIRSEGADAAWARIVAERGLLGSAFDSFLARHGHRLIGRDLLSQTWGEAPALVLALAAQSARVTLAAERAAPGSAVHDKPTPASAEANTDRRLQATAAIEREIGGGTVGLLRRVAFRAALAQAQRYQVVRENMRYHADYFMARLRQLALALGTQLVAAGRLVAPIDVCFLTFDELGRALESSEPLNAIVAERRAAFEHDSELCPPSTLMPEEIAPPASAGVATTLRGEPGAPGHCRARARLVHSQADFDGVERGEVLVAACADPGWAPVLELAGGLVLEAGGLLSHGAIVARELRIPALVGVANATQAIENGDSVDLDAETGVVTIIARARQRPF